MATQVTAYRAANGSAVKGESWKPHTVEDNIVRSLPVDDQSTIILGDVDVKDSKDIIFDNVLVFEGPVTVQRVDVDNSVPTKKKADPDDTSSRTRNLLVGSEGRWELWVIDIRNHVAGVETQRPEDDGRVSHRNVGNERTYLVEKPERTSSAAFARKAPDPTSSVEVKSPSDPCGFGSCAFRWAIGLAIVALVVIAITATLVSTFGDKEEKSLLVRREEWGGLPPKHPADNLTLPVPYVIISHTATDFCMSLEECSAVVRSVQNYHMDSRKWWDIGYNFLVGGDGRAYEARGWDAVGAHAKSYNNVSIGLSFIGTFMDVEPEDRQVDAAKRLIEEGVRLGKVAKDYVLLAHRQVSPTESPGEKLYEMMKHWPHWSELLS